jgi:CubicO group peptidase (beta-lactamase class C family)
MLIHDGMTGGFASFACVVPENEICVVVLANQARTVGGIGMKALKAVTG